MAITYNAGTNTITVTGYTEGTPCTFLDIYNADVSGAWGKVSRQCTNQFCIQAKLIIGDGSTATWFADTEQMIIFTGIFSSDTWNNEIINVLANAHFRLGESVTGKTTKKGCSLMCGWTSSWRCSVIDGNGISSAVELYDFTLYYLNDNQPRFYRCEAGKFYNVSSTTNQSGISFQVCSNLDVYNINTSKNYMFIQGSDGTFNRIFIGNTHFLATLDGNTVANVTIKNVEIIGSIAHSLFRGYQSSYNLYAVNVTSTSWVMSYVSYTGKFYRQYEFDLKVINKDNVAINGATVKIWDKDSTQLVDTTTNASGVIATQTITRGYYNQANGNTLQEASPHLIKITKAGYTTYEADFTLEDKTDWLIALQVGGGLMRNPPMTGGMV